MTKLKVGDLVHLRQRPSRYPTTTSWDESLAVYLGLLTPEEVGYGSCHNDEQYYAFHLQSEGRIYFVEHGVGSQKSINPTGSWKDLKEALCRTEITLLGAK